MRYLAVLLFACGPSFDGRWTGALESFGVCGSGGSLTSGPVDWTIRETEAVVTVTPKGGNCGSFVADLTGDLAIVRSQPCGSGFLFTSGRLALGPPDLLTVVIESSSTGASTTCAGVAEGLLMRQR